MITSSLRNRSWVSGIPKGGLFLCMTKKPGCMTKTNVCMTSSLPAWLHTFYPSAARPLKSPCFSHLPVLYVNYFWTQFYMFFYILDSFACSAFYIYLHYLPRSFFCCTSCKLWVKTLNKQEVIHWKYFAWNFKCYFSALSIYLSLVSEAEKTKKYRIKAPVCKSQLHFPKHYPAYISERNDW